MKPGSLVSHRAPSPLFPRPFLQLVLRDYFWALADWHVDMSFVSGFHVNIIDTPSTLFSVESTGLTEGKPSR